MAFRGHQTRTQPARGEAAELGNGAARATKKESQLG
jgi:hypothetical protein